MTEAVVATTGRRLDARFTILDRLGAGGQGEVRLAHDEVRGVDVALKIVTPSPAKREAAWAALTHEYEISSRLNHPCILKVYPPERSGDMVALPMELASGGDLRKLRGSGYLEIVPVLIEVAQALEHAHERGVVHRDLKPGNVLFDSRGRVKLADFGVAGFVDAEPEEASRGLSPFTASPEQLRGEPPLPSDDVYGLGALAYELFSGYPPYYPHFDVQRAMEEPVPTMKPTRQVPPLLSALVMRMLSKRAINRPRSMREVIDELDSALNDTLTFDMSDPTMAGFKPVGFTLPPALTPTVSAEELRADRSGAADPALRAAEAAAPLPPPHDIPALQAREDVLRARERTTEQTTERATDAMPPMPPLRARDDVSVVPPLPSVSPRPKPRSAFDDLQQFVPAPRSARLEPIRARRWPWVVLALALVAGVAWFYVLPDYAPDAVSRGLSITEADLKGRAAATTPASASAPAEGDKAVSSDKTPAPTQAPAGTAVPPGAAAAPDTARPVAGSSGQAAPVAALQNTAAAPPAEAEATYKSSRQNVDTRLASLDNRGAGIWGGRDFSDAKMLSAEAIGAHDAGNTKVALSRLSQAAALVERVERRARQAFDAQIDAGDKALAAGQGELAAQAFDLARRIDPNDKRVQAGQRRTRSLSGVLPLLADGENAERARNYGRASQDYSQALSLDPGSEQAKQGLTRANAAFGDDNYAKAVGAGFAALGAGRLDDAHDSFEKARAIKPNGAEASEGLRRVGAAIAARGYASARQKGAALEAQERWNDAAQEYEAALRADPSLVFAQQGKTRATGRAEMSLRLQALIDEPSRLSTPAVRDEARDLLQSARMQDSAGPVLRSQITRLGALLPDFDKAVRLQLVSDNATQISIPSIGAFGTFARREIELKPGRYTVIGTRNGFRDVRRDITVSPGQGSQTVSITCSEPI